MRRSSNTSRTPASTTTPTHPLAITDVASSSPNIPFVEGAVVAMMRMSPGSMTSTAAWIMMLSPGAQETVTAEPEIRAPS